MYQVIEYGGPPRIRMVGGGKFGFEGVRSQRTQDYTAKTEYACDQSLRAWGHEGGKYFGTQFQWLCLGSLREG